MILPLPTTAGFLSGCLRRCVHDQKGDSPAGAVSDLLVPLLAGGDDGMEGLEGYHRMVDDRMDLRPRLLRMYEQYEDELTDLLIAVRSEQSQPCLYGVG